MVFPELNKHLIISGADDDDNNEEEEKMNIGKNQVLVKVRAFSVNPLDAEVARGYLGKFLPRLDGGKGGIGLDWGKTLAAKSTGNWEEEEEMTEESLRLGTRCLERYPRRILGTGRWRSTSPRRPETVDEKTKTVDA